MGDMHTFLEPVEKRKSKKLDWIIYILALVSFVLMILVIIHNNSTSKIFEPQKTESVVMNYGDEDVKKTSETPAVNKLDMGEKTVTKDETADILAEETGVKKEQEDIVTDNSVKKDQKVEEKTVVPVETKKETESLVQEKKSVSKVEEKVIEKTKVAETVTTKPMKKDTITKTTAQDGEYNWNMLSRYETKPSHGLKVATKYRVQNGDALWKIAQKYNVRTINIVALNKQLRNPDVIVPGQVISIPNR